MDQKEINAITRRMIEFGKMMFKPPELTDREKVKLELLIEIYKSSPETRDYIDLSIDLYSRAFIKERTEILMDGLRKLGEIVFPGAVNEGP